MPASTTPTERDPLLSRRRTEDEVEDVETTSKASHKQQKKRLGPLDLDRRTRWGILAGIWTATFLSSVNQTLVPTMLPAISSEFNKSNQASWLGTAYLLATCTFTPLYGRLCNVLGRKGAQRTAIIFCGLGVMLCGLSTNLETLILARFLAGVGGGGLMTTSSIIVSDMYTLRSRGLTQGVQSVFGGLGLGLGGPLGGLITDWLGWRWAFLVQMPLFLLSFTLTSINLNYVTEGKGKSAKEMIKRIDYGGSATLMMAVGSCLLFLSAKYNEGLPWSDPFVITSCTFAAIFAVTFVIVELFVAPEPVLAPALLKQPIPVLVGCSNFLVATCNFSIMYFLPMWFQTVCLTSASIAGLHLLPNSLSMSCGSLFAGWVMHATGRYKAINLIFGIFPFIGAVSIYRLKIDSNFWVQWFSIVPLGFGNAVVLQTMLIALLVHLPDDQMAVGTGFGQLFRGVGQVGGVAISSAVFQSMLESELKKRITGPDSEALVKKIRQNARLIKHLPPDIRKLAQESYRTSLKSVFFFAACMTLLAYLVRLPIPDKHLDRVPTKRSKHARDEASEESQTRPESATVAEAETGQTTPTLRSPSEVEEDNEDEVASDNDDLNTERQGKDIHREPRRRLSTYDDISVSLDPQERYMKPT